MPSSIGSRVSTIRAPFVERGSYDLGRSQLAVPPLGHGFHGTFRGRRPSRSPGRLLHDLAMAEWHLRALEERLLRRGWQVVDVREAQSVQVSATWELARGDARLLLDSLSTGTAGASGGRQLRRPCTRPRRPRSLLREESHAGASEPIAGAGRGILCL